ncbi:hypothetical protein M8J77_021438 [Diaphorina citri]|nr:hypothetical protein M8J77_021438 [Diaphorina citri]
MRAEKWKGTVESMNFTHSSRKAWSVIRKLGGANRPNSKTVNIHPDKIAKRIVQVSKSEPDKEISRKVQQELKELRRTTDPNSTVSGAFSEDEINEALLDTKTGKAAGFDEMYPEFLTNCGPRTRKWLCAFFTDILLTNRLPTDFKKTKVIALLKPNKPNDVPESYRPIALLSVCLKLLERLIFNRIAPISFSQLFPVKGFI